MSPKAWPELDLWESEKVATEKGHKMGRFRDGVSYCFHKDCIASVKINGSLADLTAWGSAFAEECPYRGA